MVDAATIIYIVSAILIIYSIIQAIVGAGNKYVKAIFIIGIIGFIIGAAVWVYYENANNDDIEKIINDESNSDRETIYDSDNETCHFSNNRSKTGEKGIESLDNIDIEDKYIETFVVSDSPVKTDVDCITYSKFKEIINTDSFIDEFSKAMQYSFNYKTKLYAKIIKDLRKQIETLKPSSDFFTPLKPSDSDILSSIEDAHQQCTDIMKKIQARRDNFSRNEIKNSLRKAIYHPDYGLESIIGCTPAKNFIALQLFSYARNPDIFFKGFQNILIYGPSGIGKTKLSYVIGHVYALTGILMRSNVRVITKNQLTTAFVNESSHITQKILLSNLESIIHIDEAYDLTPPKNSFGMMNVDHGSEALVEIINFLDKYMGCNVIIASGYEKEMEERFVEANEGVTRRFPHKIILKEYSAKELSKLLVKFLKNSCPDIIVGSEDIHYIHGLISHLDNYNVFEQQAGSMINLAGDIARCIYGSLSSKWAPESDASRSMIINGVNNFLSKKGISITPNTVDL